MATQVLPFIAVQDLTYTARQLGVAITVSYTNTGTAGSEVVTADIPNRTISVAIGATSTATQIKAAVDASPDAMFLVSVAITGTGSNVQLTCKSAPLAGGAAVATASKTFGGVLTLTSVASGTAGNSIRFKLTAGATAGSEAVTVSSSDITVQIAEGVSTWAQVKTAIDNDSGAHALVTCTSAGPALSRVATTDSALAFTALTGGLAAAAPSVVVQDLTIASDTTGTALNGKTFSYTTGATAGSEVVTVSSGNINVQIENGVSTATQIETALNAAAAFTTPYNVTVTGTGATAQKTVNAATMAGAVGVGAETYFVNATATALTASFVWFPFGFAATRMVVNCDETSGAKGVVLSFDGVNSADTVLFAQTSEYNPMTPIRGIWMKYVSAAPAYRVHAWR